MSLFFYALCFKEVHNYVPKQAKIKTFSSWALQQFLMRAVNATDPDAIIRG